jgi:cytoskeletal protein RodZ
MEPEATSFEQFLSTKIKERGITLKKLSDATGIAPSHIESMLRGDFDAMPSAPYFRGYLIRLGEILGFNGEEWWKRLQAEGQIKNSGPTDMMPRNRFTRESPPKYLWAVGVGVLIVLYLAFQAPHILGKPVIAVTFPSANPYTTQSSTVTIAGTVSDADTLYLNDTQQITINPDGSWEETVLLGAGPNPFKISAKKFLGGETDVTENILYEPAGAPAGGMGAGATSTATSTIPSSSPS